MIPIVAGILGGGTAAAGSCRGVVGRTLCYALGLALVYSLLGLIAGMSGKLFGSVSSNRWLSFAMGNLLLIAGLALLDAFTVAVPARIAGWAAQVGGSTPSGALAMGAVSGLVAAPCGAPAFAAVLAFVTTTRSGTLGLVYLLAFSLGMTALLVLIGLAAGSLSRLPRSGPWMVWIKRLCGAILIGVAEYYFYRMGLVS